jgi:hypothetical protein
MAIWDLRISDVSKLKLSVLSDLSTAFDARECLYDVLDASRRLQIIVGAEVSVVEQYSPYDIGSVVISPDGHMVYILANEDDADTAYSLYTITIEDGKAGMPELYDTDVNAISRTCTDDTHVVYFKDKKDDVGDLYLNGTVIDYDVYIWNASAAGDALIYYTDWDADTEQGTLRIYEDGKKITIADDVVDYLVTGNGDILYLCDYSTTYYSGTLYRYRNGESTKLSDDVIVLIKLEDERYHEA